jgi:hypothetical protein
MHTFDTVVLLSNNLKFKKNYIGKLSQLKNDEPLEIQKQMVINQISELHILSYPGKYQNSQISPQVPLNSCE